MSPIRLNSRLPQRGATSCRSAPDDIGYELMPLIRSCSQPASAHASPNGTQQLRSDAISHGQHKKPAALPPHRHMPSKLKSSDPESSPSTSGDSAAPTLGLREKHKIDKLRRIRSSARKVFLEKGFDAATTREVAEIAEVSHATVFLYAKDKRDLLFLVFNDD